MNTALLFEKKWLSLSDLSMKELRLFIIITLWQISSLFLSYNFTKKRPLKICKIEKINRQMPNKNGLIFTK